MSLNYDKVRDTQRRVQTAFYNGTAYTKHFTCPSGEISTHLGQSLALGHWLPTVWGGSESSDAEVPRLQHVEMGRQAGGGMWELSAVYVDVDLRG